jgi:hypothetical protein
MLKRAFGGYPPCILPDTPAFGFHARRKIVLAVDEKSDKWRQVRTKVGSRLDYLSRRQFYSLFLLYVVCATLASGKARAVIILISPIH